MKKYTIDTDAGTGWEYEATDADHAAEQFATDENYVNVVCVVGLRKRYERLGDGAWFVIRDEDGITVAHGGDVPAGRM